jgi:hypothetical protein
MNKQIESVPVLSDLTGHLPQPVLPVERVEPEVDPFREVRELAEAVKADCQSEPKLYLNEICVAGGGE